METGQNPLEAILFKSINQATPKLQRLMIRTFPYHFTVQYIPELTNQHADCLSQLGGQRDTIKLPNYMPIKLPTSCALEVTVYSKLELLHEKVMSLHCSSIPSHKVAQAQLRKFQSARQSYWTFREELMIEGGIILKGTRIVIPAKKHKAVLKLIHEGHLGLNKCKLHAKETVYWPGLNDQLEKLILNCELCLKYSHF